MTELLATYEHQLMVFLLVLTRISGLVLLAPIFGPRYAPMTVRVFLVVILSLLVCPLYWSVQIPMPGTLFTLAVLLGREVALGLALGLAMTILFSGLQLSGTIIGQMSGLQLAEVFDPTFDESVPVFSQLLDLVALGAFVATSGHRRVLAALLDTFKWRPPGTDDFPDSVVATLTAVLTESFVVGIRTAAPVMISLLLSVLVLGLISRTVPQLNVFGVGFNLNAMFVLATLAFSLATMTVVVENRSNEILLAVRDAVARDIPLP